VRRSGWLDAGMRLPGGAGRRENEGEVDEEYQILISNKKEAGQMGLF
jgi:hypothetical protein